jgi:hypothetical protein
MLEAVVKGMKTVCAVLALVSAGAAAEAGGTAIVTLADGTTVPLNPWTFSYEYVAYPAGTSAALAPFSRREARTLWTGKRASDTAGLALEIGYQALEREREVDGQMKKVTVLVARELRLVAPDGRKTVLKVEPPGREALLEGGGKGLVVAPRSLDLQGQTLTGTKSSYCLASYTSLVECGGDPAHQVTRVEFR